MLLSNDIGHASRIGVRENEEMPIEEITNLDGQVVSFMKDKNIPQTLHK